MYLYKIKLELKLISYVPTEKILKVINENLADISIIKYEVIKEG
jgi:hypothetical protein